MTLVAIYKEHDGIDEHVADVYMDRVPICGEYLCLNAKGKNPATFIVHDVVHFVNKSGLIGDDKGNATVRLYVERSDLIDDILNIKSE